jgi:hypothetical protein
VGARRSNFRKSKQEIKSFFDHEIASALTNRCPVEGKGRGKMEETHIPAKKKFQKILGNFEMIMRLNFMRSKFNFFIRSNF